MKSKSSNKQQSKDDTTIVTDLSTKKVSKTPPIPTSTPVLVIATVSSYFSFKLSQGSLISVNAGN